MRESLQREEQGQAVLLFELIYLVQLLDKKGSWETIMRSCTKKPKKKVERVFQGQTRK